MTKTLKKEFINKKIPFRYRGLIPVICAGSDTDIVCVPFIGTSDKYKNHEGKYNTYTFCLKKNEHNNPEKAGKNYEIQPTNGDFYVVFILMVVLRLLCSQIKILQESHIQRRR